MEPRSFFILLLALALDAVIGDPDWLWRSLPHPIVAMGKVIDFFDARWNDPAASFQSRKIWGTVALVGLALGAFFIGATISALCRGFTGGFVVEAVIACVFLAQKSLYEHVSFVADSFRTGGIEAARAAVGRIVGRDTKRLDEPAICRAAIESCAENFSDGIVAPAFYLAFFGLPGLFVYKIVNTADSMIGHLTPKHEAFGWASARFDDLLNFIPSRIAGGLLALGAPFIGGSTKKSFSIMRRQAYQHRSPNAGWPESAAAGALDVALLGPRIYEGREVKDPFFNVTGHVAGLADIGRMLRLFIIACAIEFLVYLVIALVVW